MCRVKSAFRWGTSGAGCGMLAAMMTLRSVGLAGLLALAGCAGDPPPDETWVCHTPDSSCVLFGAGWSEAEAMSGCNSLISSFYVGSSCPAGFTSRCAQTVDGKSAVTHYYPNFGDGTPEYALMTCQLNGGAFSSP